LKTKKADIYFEGSNKEIRVSVSFKETDTILDMMLAISDTISDHASGDVKIMSIYFIEEVTK